MKKIVKVLIILLSFMAFFDNVFAYYETSCNKNIVFISSAYNFIVDLNGGTLNNMNAYYKNNKFYINNPSRNGYNFNGWLIEGNNYKAKWIDNIGPTIMPFNVEILGFFDPAYGVKKGWNVRVTINAIDEGSGVKEYQTWLIPYGNGSGGVRKYGNVRLMENVLYLNTDSGRTFCASVIDNAGNYSERCEIIKI